MKFDRLFLRSLTAAEKPASTTTPAQKLAQPQQP